MTITWLDGFNNYMPENKEEKIMNKTKIEHTIQDLEANLAELKAQLAETAADPEPEQKGRRKPGYHEEYFFVSNRGSIESDIWDGMPSDEARFARGNCFPTEAEAKLADDRRALKQKMRDFADEWAGDDEGPIYAYWNGLKKEWKYIWFADAKHILPGAPRFPSVACFEAALKHFGDRLNILREDA